MAVFDKKKLKELNEKKITKGHTIMVVDDDEAQISSLDSLLSEEYYVIRALDGKAALDCIKRMEHPEKISLIISDQRMPKLTGLQLFEKIKNIIPKTKRMILTAYDDKDVIMDGINKAEIDKFILKPFEPGDFKLSVKRAIEEFENQAKKEEYRWTLEKQYKKLKQKNKELQEATREL